MSDTKKAAENVNTPKAVDVSPSCTPDVFTRESIEKSMSNILAQKSDTSAELADIEEKIKSLKRRKIDLKKLQYRISGSVETFKSVLGIPQQ